MECVQISEGDHWIIAYLPLRNPEQIVEIVAHYESSLTVDVREAK